MVTVKPTAAIQTNLRKEQSKAKKSNDQQITRSFFPTLGQPNFTFYGINRFKSIKKETAPVNKYVRIAGYVHINKDNVYLKLNSPEESVKISLDYMDMYPELGLFIEVFGKIYFDTISVPYVQSYFYRNLSGSHEEYEELCTKINEMM